MTEQMARIPLHLVPPVELHRGLRVRAPPADVLSLITAERRARELQSPPRHG